MATYELEALLDYMRSSLKKRKRRMEGKKKDREGKQAGDVL